MKSAFNLIKEPPVSYWELFRTCLKGILYCINPLPHLPHKRIPFHATLWQTKKKNFLIKKEKKFPRLFLLVSTFSPFPQRVTEKILFERLPQSHTPKKRAKKRRIKKKKSGELVSHSSIECQGHWDSIHAKSTDAHHSPSDDKQKVVRRLQRPMEEGREGESEWGIRLGKRYVIESVYIHTIHIKTHAHESFVHRDAYSENGSRGNKGS